MQFQLKMLKFQFLKAVSQTFQVRIVGVKSSECLKIAISLCKQRAWVTEFWITEFQNCNYRVIILFWVFVGFWVVSNNPIQGLNA